MNRYIQGVHKSFNTKYQHISVLRLIHMEVLGQIKRIKPNLPA